MAKVTWPLGTVVSPDLHDGFLGHDSVDRSFSHKDYIYLLALLGLSVILKIIFLDAGYKGRGR